MMYMDKKIGGPVNGVYIDLDQNQVLVGQHGNATKNSTMASLEAKIKAAVGAMNWTQLKSWINSIMQQFAAAAAPVAKEILEQAEKEGLTPQQGFAYLKAQLGARNIEIPESQEMMQAASDKAAEIVGKQLVKAQQAGYTIPAIIGVVLLFLYLRR